MSTNNIFQNTGSKGRESQLMTMVLELRTKDHVFTCGCGKAYDMQKDRIAAICHAALVCERPLLNEAMSFIEMNLPDAA